MDFNGRLFTFPLRTTLRLFMLIWLWKSVGVVRDDRNRDISILKAHRMFQQMFRFGCRKVETVNGSPKWKLVLRLTWWALSNYCKNLSKLGAWMLSKTTSKPPISPNYSPSESQSRNCLRKILNCSRHKRSMRAGRCNYTSAAGISFLSIRLDPVNYSNYDNFLHTYGTPESFG